jgi:hypothetical protein
MALVIGVNVGKEIAVGEHKITVISVDSSDQVTIAREDGKIFRVCTTKSTEILPDVYVSIGSETARWGLRLAFEAPLGIKIGRADFKGKCD